MNYKYSDPKDKKKSRESELGVLPTLTLRNVNGIAAAVTVLCEITVINSRTSFSGTVCNCVSVQQAQSTLQEQVFLTRCGITQAVLLPCSIKSEHTSQRACLFSAHCSFHTQHPKSSSYICLPENNKQHFTLGGYFIWCTCTV